MSERVRLLLVLSVSGLAACGRADPPEGYYDSITGSDGPTIKSQLTPLLNSAITRSYDAARNILQVTDEDQANPDNIILTYTGQSIPSVWVSGTTWNREHCWPRSLGVGDSGPDYSDLHMLRPCNSSVNGSRGNKQFGTGPGQWDPDQFGVQFRGEMARVVFYANTRYTYLSIPVIGSQAQFVDWHFEQMPDDEDRRRNDSVYVYQLNRNPFVDHPEWVWAVYGDGPSDAQITIAGAMSADGATSTTIDLGPFIGGPTPPGASVQIDKAGAAPTTYLVSVDGDVISDAATGYQAGFARNAASLSIPVSLTGGPGLVQGTLTVDNTDPTSAGAGFGDADGDDVVTLTGFSLEPSLPSFEQAGPVTEVTIDLGQIPAGQSTGPIPVEIWNLADGSVGAALDIDGVTITGLADGVSLVGAPVTGVAPGAAGTLLLTVEPSAVGTIEATATIAVSDEDLPGETQTELSLTILASAVNACPADVNGDGVVDPSDLNAWIFAFNNGTPACDVNGDGFCRPDDFSAWVFFYNAGCP